MNESICLIIMLFPGDRRVLLLTAEGHDELKHMHLGSGQKRLLGASCPSSVSIMYHLKCTALEMMF